MSLSNPPDLFAAAPAAAEDGYLTLRSANSDEASLCREFCLQLWKNFAPLADDGFVEDFPVHMHQRFWEMYLAATLAAAGHTLVARKPGPDFGLVLNGKRVWIEAVAATRGDSKSPNSVPPYQPPVWPPVARTVPQEKIVLRCTAAISAKFPTQYRKHLDLGVIGPEDCYVIAVNHAQAYDWSEVGAPPYILRAVFGISHHYVTLDRASGDIINSGVQYAGSIPKTVGARVDTNLFLTSEASPVSAVIGSVTTVGNPVDVGQLAHPCGVDFRLVHNLKAANPLPDGLLIRGRQYVAIEGTEEFLIQERDFS